MPRLPDISHLTFLTWINLSLSPAVPRIFLSTVLFNCKAFSLEIPPRRRFCPCATAEVSRASSALHSEPVSSSLSALRFLAGSATERDCVNRRIFTRSRWRCSASSSISSTSLSPRRAAEADRLRSLPDPAINRTQATLPNASRDAPLSRVSNPGQFAGWLFSLEDASSLRVCHRNLPSSDDLPRFREPASISSSRSARRASSNCRFCAKKCKRAWSAVTSP